VPFTLSHAAAALPFRRTRLIPSAIVIGCFSPDFEYFLRLRHHGEFGHTLPGVFLLDLPVSLAVLWLFHRYAKEPLWTWLPARMRRRIPLGPTAPPLRSLAQCALAAVSILLGAATHILWDSFTHPFYWPYYHWRLLRTTVQLPLLGAVPYYGLFQHASSLLGLIVILVWWLRWSRSAPLRSTLGAHTSGRERKILFAAVFIALAAAALRAFSTPPLRTFEATLAETVVTAMTVFWVEVVIYGIVRDRSRRPVHTT
jgi:hypothetical protein